MSATTRLVTILIRFIYGVAILVLICALLISAIWLTDVHTKRRAESLLGDVGALQVGISTMRQVEPILRGYPGAEVSGSWPCRSADRFYSVRVANDTVNWIGRRLPLGRGQLVRPYGAVAVVLLSRGTVCYVQYYAGTILPGFDQELDVSTTVLAAADASRLREADYMVDAGILQGRYHMIKVYVASGASGEAREHAFTYNFSCWTSLRGCHAPCEMMPSAWLDYQKEARANGWSLPAEDVNDPRCPKLQDR